MKEFITVLYPVLSVVWVAIAAYATKVLVPEVVRYVVEKQLVVKLANYKTVAIDIYNKLNEDGRLGKFLGDKEQQFGILIKKVFPKISDSDINLLNKSIAGIENAGKSVVAEVVADSPVVTPVSYFDPLTGAPLTPGVLPVMPIV